MNELSKKERGSPILELTSLTKRYGNADAVSNVSMKVYEGEFVTLLGASGSGKSTVLMMIAGFTEPTSGDIRVAGQSIVNVAPHKRRIGVVFQNYALFPHLSVYENIAFPLRNARKSEQEIESRVKELVATVRLDSLQQRLPGQLSGGQQQRVAIARALANKPDILLFDEPLGALDKSLREHMVVELQHLHRQLGTTMVYVTHDQEEALVMSDRIAVMDGGKVVALDSPQNLYDNPRSVFAAEFLGHSNVLTTSDGKLSAVRPERVVIGDIPAGWVSMTGKITEAIFLGNRMRYDVTVDGNQTIIVSIPRTNGVTMLPVGSNSTIGWHPDDARPVEPGHGSGSVERMNGFDATRLAGRPIRVSDGELARRRSAVVESFTARGFSHFVAMDFVTIRYLTGYPLVPNERPFAAILDDSGSSTMFVPLLKAHDVTMRASADRVVAYREYPGRTHPVRALAALISEMKPKRALLEIDEHHVPFGYRGPSLSFSLDCEFELDRELVQRIRMVKSSEEIELLRHASDWSVFAQGCLQAATHVGNCESKIAGEATAVAMKTMREIYGDQDRKMLVSAGFGGQIGSDGTTHHYQSAVDPIVAAGDLMITRVFAQIGGYYSDIERTMICSGASSAASDLFKQGQEIQSLALDLVRPGVTVAQIDQAVSDRFTSLGIEDYWRHHTGHSVGILEREAPYVDIGSNTLLEPGMVVTIEPGVYRPGVGGFRHSDCVLITDLGKEILTEWPRDLNSLTIA